MSVSLCLRLSAFVFVFVLVFLFVFMAVFVLFLCLNFCLNLRLDFLGVSVRLWTCIILNSFLSKTLSGPCSSNGVDLIKEHFRTSEGIYKLVHNVGFYTVLGLKHPKLVL